MFETGHLSLGITRRPRENNLPAAITDIGCEREINEDRYAVIDSPSGCAWIVCDGMGGELGGELAAQLAIDAVRRTLESREVADIAEVISFAVEEANRSIVLRRQNPAFSSMGTTLVGMMSRDEEYVVVNAGDSRAYLVRNGQIQRLTVDHTYVQELVDRGLISEKEALYHPQAHVLTRCLGAEPGLKLDVQTLWLWEADLGEDGDKILLCSDGLYSQVEDDELAEIVSTHSPQEACVQLVDLTKSRGGFDNITVAIIPLPGQLREQASPESKLCRKKKQDLQRMQRGYASVRKSETSIMGYVLLSILWAALGAGVGFVSFCIKFCGVFG